jgi:hypothetical protein
MMILRSGRSRWPRCPTFSSGLVTNSTAPAFMASKTASETLETT